MKSSRRIFGVPLHPLLVHFPIAFWLVLPPLDLAALFIAPAPWGALAQGAALLGVVIGAAAIVVGFLEYLDPSLAGIDVRLAARHGVRTTLAWCLFAARLAAAAILPAEKTTLLLCLALDVIGCGLLLQGILFGTRQVYQQLDK